MSLPVVNQCCCGCSLETGCKIIGWMQIVGFPLSVVVFLLMHYLETYVELYADGFNGLFLFVIIPLCALLQGTILVLGIRRKKPGYLSFWVNSTFFVVILTLSFITYAYIESTYYEHLHIVHLENFFSFVIAGPCITVINIYYAIVVSSHMKELRRLISRTQNEMNQLSGIHFENPESENFLTPSTYIPTHE